MTGLAAGGSVAGGSVAGGRLLAAAGTWVTTALPVGVDPSKVQAGYFGMGVVAVLAVATYLLIRSLRRQMRKIGTSALPHDAARPHGPRPSVRLPVADSPEDAATAFGGDHDDQSSGPSPR